MVTGLEEVLQNRNQDDTGHSTGEAAVIQAEALVEGDDGSDHAGVEQTGCTGLLYDPVEHITPDDPAYPELANMKDGDQKK